jgi:hypothetical protein
VLLAPVCDVAEGCGRALAEAQGGGLGFDGQRDG